ncbi:golgin candidate 3-like [Hibiscus syriacus]|uniref:golgin candidate 3-like n=1 Tax=Hibiscus syriacus TaxID=106335 RepID=UPI001923AEB7|nr:golgin candidate 3-like [Hibiscus syriacus]
MELSLQKLEKDLRETRRERDTAFQELTRLKQHLLEKVAGPLTFYGISGENFALYIFKLLMYYGLSQRDSEESVKMDEDRKIIEQLRESNEYQRAHIAHLEELKLMNTNEIQKSKEIIDKKNKQLDGCARAILTKNAEILNLETALGQYYAEIEAKEHLERDLGLATQESARLTGLLKDADERAELSNKEKEEILAKLSQTERMVAEGQTRVKKLEEDNGKLRRALEQSGTRLNTMSVDSDHLVDRLHFLHAYCDQTTRDLLPEKPQQRGIMVQVLDLMVRMLGFSDEDKQRIGVAQHDAGKGVVRGVLSLPGRLVGGIFGASSADVHANIGPDNQISGLIFCSRKAKKEKRGNQQKMLVDPA